MFRRKYKAIDKPEGYIYIASNQGMPGIIKIGMTYKAPAKRLAELYTTGVPYPFVLEYQCQVPDRRAAERYLHQYFSAQRISNNREFFSVNVNDAAKITHSRVANKQVSYKPPARKFRRFIYLSAIVAAGTGILYKTGHITESVDTMLPQIRNALQELITRWPVEL